MNRNSQPATKENVIFLKGDTDKIRIDGSAPLPKIVFHPSALSKLKNLGSGVNPVKIYSQDNVLAVIDENDEAWLMTQQFDFPINLSQLVKTKVKHIYLGEKELIAKTKKGNILVNWGTKKLLDQQLLVKQPVGASFSYDSLFEVYSISGYQSADIYMYCPQPKVDNSNRLYYFDSANAKIIGYPTRDVIQVNAKIKGISIGTHHCLCWDQHGFLYSWGSKSLGLGYAQLPTDELIEHPRPVKINKKVLSAVAAAHYSLALTEDGVIYEWGIKKQVNEINEEPIFKPRPLEFKYFRCNAKFVSLKGKQSNFGALSSNNELYIWGATAKPLISRKISIPPAWKGNYLFEPVLQTQFLGYYIHDFSIDHKYLAVVAGTSCEITGTEDYWSILKLKARKQLQNLKKIRVTTESEEVQILKKKYSNPILNFIEEKPSKNKLVAQKMKPIENITEEVSKITKQKSDRQLIKEQFNCFKRTAPVSPTNDQYWSGNSIRIHKRQCSDVPIIQAQDEQARTQPLNKWRASETSSGFDKTGQAFSRRNKFSEIYQMRLKDIMQKKKHFEESSMNSMMQRITEDSAQYRFKKKEQYLHKKRAVEDLKLLKHTLQKAFITQYLASLFRSCTDQARQIKIANFFRNLVLQRVERNIRNLFISKKIQYSLKHLQKEAAGRYMTLNFCIKRYIARFRKRRFLRSRQITVSTIIKTELLQKVTNGLSLIKSKRGQLLKMNLWLKMYNKQKKQCLKQVWNNFITLTFKVKDGGQYYFSPTDPDLTFERLYRSKLQANQLLKLKKYMRFTTPFISATEIQLSSPPKEQKRKKKGVQQKSKNGYPAEILPFSLHYNYFRRPKNFDVNVGQANRVLPFWIQTQQKTLEDHLAQILSNNNKEFAYKRRQYEVKLACFIAKNYEIFYEKRWKFILQYNKVEKTPLKKKKQYELHRLLSLVGMTKLIDQDCIPQKHIVLDQALKRKDVPRPPDPIMRFNLEDFEESFKTFVQILRSRIKLPKKMY